MMRNCIICHHIFTAKTTGILCSKECRKKNKVLTNRTREQQKRGYVGYPTESCAICDQLFKSNNSNQKSCRASHCDLMLRRQRKNRLQKEKHQRDKTNPQYVMRRLLRTCLTNFMHMKQHRSYMYCPFTMDEFKIHFERLFKNGMTWSNWGSWHIDHIQPLSSFKLCNVDGTENLTEIRKANALSNLQPLWAIDNLRKHARLLWK